MKTQAKKRTIKHKPTTGQSAPPFQRSFSEMTTHEMRVIRTIGKVVGEEKRPATIHEVAKSLRRPDLYFRNHVRRLVPSGWVQHTGRGTYRLTRRAAKKLG